MPDFLLKLSSPISEDFFNALLHHHKHHHHHHHHARPRTNNNHSMSNKTSSTSTPSSNAAVAKHVHYHLYQAQAGCCVNNNHNNSNDRSSEVTTAASSNVNASSENRDDDESSLPTQSAVNTPAAPSTTGNSNDTSRGCDEDDSLGNHENHRRRLINVEIANKNSKNFHKDDDKCSCTRKYVPYKVNEKNVWQVYETSDCKYIQSRYEVNEVFEPSSSTSTTTTTTTKATEFTTAAIATDSTAATTPSMLYSRSNFSDRIIYQARNQDEKRESSIENCTPFDDDNGKLGSTSDSPANHRNSNNSDNNVKSEAYNIDDDQHGQQQPQRSCKCVVIVDAKSCDGEEEELDDDESARGTASLSSSTRVTTSKYDTTMPTVRAATTTYRQSGKLLNRPKATNNITSRDQVKPVEREIQNEITHENGSVKTVKALKASATRPICLPSATTAPKLSSAQAFDDDCGSSASSVSDETVKENQKGKMNYENEKQQSLMRQENKVAIPNIHAAQQGWSVTVSLCVRSLRALTSVDFST